MCCDQAKTTCFNPILVYEKEPTIEAIRWFVFGMMVFLCIFNCIYLCLFVPRVDYNMYVAIGFLILFDCAVFTVGIVAFYSIEAIDNIKCPS